MKILCWNTRGLGNPRGVRALHDLTRRESPYILFLMETKFVARKLEAIRLKIGMYDCIEVDSEGRGGVWH